jgi:hypothetical protein
VKVVGVLRKGTSALVECRAVVEVRLVVEIVVVYVV